MSSPSRDGTDRSSSSKSAPDRDEVAERLRRRYPRSRVPRPVVIALVGIGTALALWWLVTTALHHSQPAAAAQVSAFTIRSDTRIAVSMTVDRLDPSVTVSCRVVAQAQDFQIVGEQAVRVPSGTARLVNVSVELVTLRRATTATVKGCAPD